MNNITEQIGLIVEQHRNGVYQDALTRFSYLGEGAGDFLEFIRDPNYTGFRQEVLMLRRMIDEFRDRFRGSHVVDLGPGDGLKAMEILSLADSYLALDMSEEMLEIAERNHEGFGGVSRRYERADFSCPENISAQGDFVLLLGNTLTNEVDMQSYLLGLREALGRAHLLVGVELGDGQDPARIEAEYDTEENRRLTFRPLGMIGVDESEGVLEIRFNQERQRVEETFTFNDGRRVLLSVTHKPGREDFLRIVETSGWTVIDKRQEGNQFLFLFEN